MILATQLKVARALLEMDQRALAAVAGLSLPTIQRMEASNGTIRGNVDSLVKLIARIPKSNTRAASFYETRPRTLVLPTLRRRPARHVARWL